MESTGLSPANPLPSSFAGTIFMPIPRDLGSREKVVLDASHFPLAGYIIFPNFTCGLLMLNFPLYLSTPCLVLCSLRVG